VWQLRPSRKARRIGQVAEHAIAGMTIIHSDSVVSIERGTSCFRMKASKNCRAFSSYPV
jgi:hypothetical protein